MRITKIHKITFFLFLFFILLNTVFVLDIRKSRERNIRLNYLKQYIPWSEQIECQDPLYGSYIKYWSNRYYKLNSINNSRTANYVLNKNPRIKDILQNNKYSSLFNVFRELKLLGYHNEEYNLIKDWVSYKDNNEWIFNNFPDGDDLLYYLLNNYLDQSVLAFNNFEFDKSKELQRELFKRIKLIDTEPFDNTDSYTNERISKIYLTCMVLNSSVNNLKQYKEISYLLNKIIIPENYQKTILIKTNNSNIKNMIILLQSIYLIKEKSYHQARNMLNTYTGSDNFIMNEIVNLQKARCIFWISDLNELSNNEFKNLKKELLSLMNSSKLSTFKNDINEYLINFRKYEKNR